MNCINKAELDLIEKMRLLWSQHANWTGAAITSIVLDTPNQEYVVDRLLRNPRDFGIALTPFYGKTCANKFNYLLTEHLQLAAQLIEAIMTNETCKGKQLKEAWYANGEEISLFLASINPYWSADEWKTMFYIHLDYIMEEVYHLIDGEYQQAIDVQDLLELEALEMGDMMAQGILRQFSYIFRR